MFEGSDSALLEEIRDREFWDRYENEITEAEHLQGLLDEHRQAANLAFARELSDTELNVLTDAEAITSLVQVEAGIARSQALRARLVALLAAQRPATTGEPTEAVADGPADVVPELLEVSELLAHELQMAHPYSWRAASDWSRPRWSCPGG